MYYVKEDPIIYVTLTPPCINFPKSGNILVRKLVIVTNAPKVLPDTAL